MWELRLASSDTRSTAIKFPDTFPVQTMSIMRLLRVVEEKAPEKLVPITDAFFGQIWGVESKGASAAAKPENFRSVLSTSLVSDEELKSLMDAAVSTENKDRIKSDAAKLVEQGAFGFVRSMALMAVACRVADIPIWPYSRGW